MKTLLAQLIQGHTLTPAQAAEAFEQVMTGRAGEAQIAAMLSIIQLRGPTVEELAAAAGVMRRHAEPVTVPAGLTVVDTCGTGGDHARTFNISTAAALVAAGAGRDRGVAVAKHGNRSVTSRSGSSQVLEALGVKLRVTRQTLTACLQEAGLCFCFAPAHHTAMKHVASVRQQLGFRTIFNLLGPLTNPAGVRRQVIGVYDPQWTQKLARVLQQLGSEHVMVVHGSAGPSAPSDGADNPRNNPSQRDNPQAGGFDELTTTGPSRVSHLCHGTISTYDLDPTSLGLTICDPADLCVDSPQASAQVIRDILSGQPGPARQIVCLNAAAALVVADLAKDLGQGLAMAQAAIDQGAGQRSLDQLIRLTQADPTPGP